MRQSKYIIPILLLLSSLNLKAQTTVGLKGGYTSAWPDYGVVELPEGAETDINGFNISLLAYKQINQWLSVGVEPGLVKRGAACMPGWQPSFDADSRVYLTYIELPVFVAFQSPIGSSKFSVGGKIGFSGSIAESAYLINVGFDGSETRSQYFFGEDGLVIGQPNLERIDFGPQAGIKLGYQVSKNSRVFIESSFYYGLKDFDKFEIAKNRSLNYSIGYSVDFKKGN